MLSNYPEYSPERDSYPPHFPSYPGQYLGATQSLNSSCDSDENQYGKSSSAANQDETWFTDFILYDSDESATGTESMSVVETSGLVPAGSNDGTLASPPLEMLPEFNLQWVIKPVPGFSISDHSESPLGSDSTSSPPSDSSSLQNDTPSKVALPRMRHYICPTCKFQNVSRYRLCEHLQQYHQSPRFICSTCCRGFQAKKDLRRHSSTHDSLRPTFACSCNKSYTRLDSLQRHINAQIAKKPTETIIHKPA